MEAQYPPVLFLLSLTFETPAQQKRTPETCQNSDPTRFPKSIHVLKGVPNIGSTLPDSAVLAQFSMFLEP